jgi:CRISPR/Cas system-associated exonuclease Cas4 (RecB family)
MINNLIALGAGKARAEKDANFTVDRSKWMNASEALSCARRQWFTKHAQKPDKGYENGWGYQERGNGVELFVLDMLTRAGVEMDLEWPHQKSLTSEEHRISGTPDGIMVDVNEAIEVKSIDPRTNVSKLPKKDHTIQLQIGMELMHLNTNHAPGMGHLVYVDASDWSKVIEFEIDRDPTILDRLAPRATKILNARKAKSLDPEGALTGECKYCPFREACGEATDLFNEGPKVQKKSREGSALAEIAHDYITAKNHIDDYKTLLDKCKQQITAELAKRKAQKITLGNIFIELSEVSGRRSLDRTAMEQAGIDLAPYEKTGASSTRLTVKEV